MPDPQETDPETEETPLIKQLREQLEKSQKEAKAGKEAQRELAFTRAGFDTTAPLVQFAMGNYDGELDPDAIKSFGTGIGLPAPTATTDPASTETDEVPTEEQRQTAERQALATGGAAPVGEQTLTGRAALEAGFTAYKDRLKEGADDTEAAKEVIGALMGDAMSNPDSPFRWDPAKHEAEAAAYEASTR